MQENGIIRPVRRDQIKRFGKALTSHEPATADRPHRLRALLHPKQVNDHADFLSQMSLESTAEQMHGIPKDSMATCFDSTASFFQGVLAEEVQYYYGFEDQDGNCWVYCVGYGV